MSRDSNALRAELTALIAQWRGEETINRKEADECHPQGEMCSRFTTYANGIRKCADELDALLREGRGETRESETIPTRLHEHCHDLVCNGDRRFAVGVPGHGCSCGTRERRERLAEASACPAPQLPQTGSIHARLLAMAENAEKMGSLCCHMSGMHDVEQCRIDCAKVLREAAAALDASPPDVDEVVEHLDDVARILDRAPSFLAKGQYSRIYEAVFRSAAAIRELSARLKGRGREGAGPLPPADFGYEIPIGEGAGPLDASSKLPCPHCGLFGNHLDSCEYEKFKAAADTGTTTPRRAR